MKHRISPATVISLVALFFSLTGAGLAASRYLITSVSQIKPSVRNALRGSVGPQGPAGPQGTSGVTGIAGPQGPAGSPPAGILTDNITIYRAGGAVAPGQQTKIRLQCPGSAMLGGGYTATDGATILVNAAGGANEWDVTGSNPTNTPQDVQGFIDCANATT